MRCFRHLAFFTLFSVVSQNGKAQSDAASLRKAVIKLDECMLKRDTAQLKSLITNSVTYGHSNGWIQDSQSILSDLYNGKMTYHTINQHVTEMAFEKSTAWVRAIATVDGTVNGQAFTTKLQILQVWIAAGNNQWKLLARQSAKL